MYFVTFFSNMYSFSANVKYRHIKPWFDSGYFIFISPGFHKQQYHSAPQNKDQV